MPKYFLYSKIALLFLLFFSLSDVGAQVITVVDQTTGFPIGNVELFGKVSGQSALTNSKGQVDATSFAPDDTLLVSHVAYRPLVMLMVGLKASKYEIKLLKSIVFLDETVVSASKWEQRKSEIPTKIEVLRPKELQIYQPQTTADFLAYSDQVFVQKSQMGGGSPSIRGFATNRILITVDGVRMNNAIFRHGNVQNIISIDPLSIEEAEVVFGPGSLIYGSDAMGGVMDFHLLTPAFSEELSTFEVSGNALLRYASANNERTSHVHVNGGGNRFAFVTSATVSLFDDLKSGKYNVYDDSYLRPEYVLPIEDYEFQGVDFIVPNRDDHKMVASGYNQFNILQKFRYKPSNSMMLTYSFIYTTTNDIPRYDRLNNYKNGVLKYGDYYYGPQSWLVNSFDLLYTKKTTLFDALNVTVGQQIAKESRHSRTLNSVEFKDRYEKVDIWSFTIDFEKKVKKMDFFYGIEGVYNKVHSDGQQRDVLTGILSPGASRYPDGSEYASFEAYFMTKYKWSEKWITNAGVRASYVLANATFDSANYGYQFAPVALRSIAPTFALGVVYHPYDNWQLNMNISSGFRAPNIDDIGKVAESEPGSIVVPNPTLKPEYVINADVGIIKKINNQYKFELTAFYSRMFDVMVREDYSLDGQDSLMYDGELSQVQAIQNRDYANIYGLNGAFYGEFTAVVSMKSTVNWVVGKDSEDYSLRHVPPVFGTTHLYVAIKKLTIDFFGTYSGEISPELLCPEEQDKVYMYATDVAYAEAQAALPEEEQVNPKGLFSPAWYTLNLRVSYRLNQQVTFDVGIDNILDQSYRSYSSGIPAPGRNISLSLRANF